MRLANLVFSAAALTVCACAKSPPSGESQGPTIEATGVLVAVGSQNNRIEIQGDKLVLEDEGESIHFEGNVTARFKVPDWEGENVGQ